MDKVKELLERHVQWIAVAVGGLVFMWALWTYVLSPDPVVSADVAGEQQVGPGEVDEVILSRLARDLEGKLDGAPAVVPEPPNLTREILASIELGEPAPRIPLASLPASPYPSGFDAVESGGEDEGLDSLPTLPPALILAVEGGRGEYEVPSPLPDDAEIDFADPDAPLPDRPTAPEDLTYAVVRYAIPAQALRQQFADTALPESYQVTNVLDVTLLRERRLPDGTWGERAEVPRLRNYLAPAMPETSASLTDKRAYMDWARANADAIVQPPFYALIQGDDPRYLADPALDDEAAGGDNADVADNPIDPDTGFHAGFDPNDRDTWPPNDELTPQERRAIRDARRNPGGDDGNPYGPGGGNPYGPGGGNPYGGGGASNGGGDNGNGGVVNLQNRGGGQPGGQPDGPPDGYYNPYGGYGGPPDGGFNPYDPYGGAEGAEGPDQPGPARDAGAVPGEFNPVRLETDIEGWAYDESAVPGETYRYNVVYSLRNPVFATTNVTDDPSLEERLAITADPTSAGWAERWSRGVRIEATARWFMKATTVDGRGARFDVFRYQNGRWQSETFKVEPGEMLGETVDGVDYATGRVLADVRTDPSSRDRVAVLVDAQGRLSVHDDDEDESADYGELARLAREGAQASAD